MLFTTRPDIICYLSRNALTLYRKNAIIANLPFADELVLNLEVIDGPKLADQITALGDKSGLRNQSVLVVLGDSVTFTRSVAHTTTAQDLAGIEDFKIKLPFEPDQKAFAVVTTRSQTVAFGTNKALFETMARALEKIPVRILAVVSASAYGVKEPAEHLDAAALAQLEGHPRLRQQANFRHTP